LNRDENCASREGRRERVPFVGAGEKSHTAGADGEKRVCRLREADGFSGGGVPPDHVGKNQERVSLKMSRGN